MALTYTTIIRGIVKKGSLDSLSDAVIEVHYRMQGADANNNIAGLNYVLNCQVDPNNFTPFNSLTEQQVLGWISDSLSQDDLNNMHDAIQNEFNKLDIVQLTSDVFPWNLPTP